MEAGHVSRRAENGEEEEEELGGMGAHTVPLLGRAARAPTALQPRPVPAELGTECGTVALPGLGLTRHQPGPDGDTAPLENSGKLSLPPEFPVTCKGACVPRAAGSWRSPKP